MYKVNPTKYTGVTVMPSEIAEKHLILSSASQLKVIIYAFSKAGSIFDAQEISSGTGIAVEEVNDALIYWKDTGFILCADNTAEFSINGCSVSEKEHSETEEKACIPTSPKKEKVPPNNPVKLNYSEICIRVAESENVRILLNEAQMRLGRTIGTGDQSSLILLHDYYGLPVEVILVICEFAATRGKATNMNYIYKIGVDWSQREIDTLEAADEELKKIEKVNSVWSAFGAQVKLPSSHPTSSQEKYFSQWTNEWGFSVPMLVLAFEEMSENTEKISFPYMHKVLSSWHKKGIDTPEKVSQDKENFIKEQENKALNRQNKKNADKNNGTVSDSNASYDLLRAEQRARASVPKLKKREKR